MYDVCTYFFFKSLDNYSQPRFESHLPQFDQRGSYTSCPAGAKNFTNNVFCHPQFIFSGVIQNIEKGNRTFTCSAHRNEPFLNGLSYSHIMET